MGFSLGSDYVIGDWTSQSNEDQHKMVWFYSGLSLIFALCLALAIGLRMASVYHYSIKSDRKLHEQMIKSVGNAPINLYYDITPIGRVLNKFSSDLNELSQWFAMLYSAELAMFYNLV
jgi:ATP-binding cassette subfamily C (CFTR/MRP) protein 1